MEYHYTSTRMVKIKKMYRSGMDVGQQELLHMAGGSANWNHYFLKLFDVIQLNFTNT